MKPVYIFIVSLQWITIAYNIASLARVLFKKSKQHGF